MRRSVESNTMVPTSTTNPVISEAEYFFNTNGLFKITSPAASNIILVALLTVGTPVAVLTNPFAVTLLNDTLLSVLTDCPMLICPVVELTLTPTPAEIDCLALLSE